MKTLDRVILAIVSTIVINYGLYYFAWRYVWAPEPERVAERYAEPMMLTYERAEFEKVNRCPLVAEVRKESGDRLHIFIRCAPW